MSVLNDSDVNNLLSPAASRLWLPHFSLSACMRCVMSRDTRNAHLAHENRFSFYPATPLCTISWYFSGDCEAVQSANAGQAQASNVPLPGRIVFSGPYTQPSVTYNPGPGHGMMLLLMPDALRLLTGLEPSQFINRTVSIADALPPAWQTMCKEVEQIRDDDARAGFIQEFLKPLWSRCRPPQALPMNRLQDWVLGLGMRAATSRNGRSLRQTERRIKQWVGLPMRELHVLARAEASFFRLLEAEPLTDVNWAHFAADSGYADQSHLCRLSRRVTGFSPQDLRQRMLTQEGFWVYRLWQ